MFLKSMEEFEVPKFPKTFDFSGTKNFSEFFSPWSFWVLSAAWPRAAAPEAEHRCIGQPSAATIPWSSGSSKPRRPWMHRAVRAVASDEDSRGKHTVGPYTKYKKIPTAYCRGLVSNSVVSQSHAYLFS